MKEPEYGMTTMATGGALCSDRGEEVRQIWTPADGHQKSTTVRYAKPFDYHFHYHHAVDDHNNLHHAVPSFEGT